MNPPKARTSDVLKTDLGEEVIIYDPESKRAHSLNPLAVSVWNHFDGQNTIADLGRLVSAEIGRPIDEPIIEDALRQLEQAHLLTRRVQEVGGKTLGRREMLRKAGQIGGAALATPIVASILVPTAAAAASPPPTAFYSFSGTAFYIFGFPADLIGGPGGNPDTSFVRITNNGPSTFNGTIGFIAVAGNGTNGTASFAVVLAPGASASVSFNNEASNQGGWNGVTGTTQNGAEFVMNGTAVLGAQSQPVVRSIFDKDIHSGVPRTNPFLETLDNYILQGGSSTGGDTGDGYETTQASGNFAFHS
jgi:hypothetical protein